MDGLKKRSINSVRNALISLFISIIVYFFSFVGRTVFVHKLSTEYLGLSGLFSSVLGFLALSELGIGNAMSYALYKPISENDKSKIDGLMRLYRKLYACVGVFILVMGITLTPFLPFLIKDSISDIPYFRVYYLIYLLNSAVSYFFIYKRSLVICYQKEYILSILMGLFNILMVLFQVLILLYTGSYLLYLICQLLITLLENIALSILVKRLFPDILNKFSEEVSITEKRKIKENIIAMFFHKVGGAFVFSSDNIIISRFIGLVQMGLYSNYTLIVNAILGFLKKIISSIVPSLGNLMVDSGKSEDMRNHSEKIFYHVLFVNAWIFGFSSICLMCLVQPFITLWIGEKYLLTDTILIVSVINFYISGMRLTVFAFKDAAGVFVQDKYKPLVEGLVNIVISIPLALKFGIAGVLLGTIISTISIAFWFEALVFFRAIYGTGFRKYILIQIGYLLFNSALVFGCYYLCSLVLYEKLLGLLLKLIICITVPNLIYLISFRKSENMDYIKKVVKNIFVKSIR